MELYRITVGDRIIRKSYYIISENRTKAVEYMNKHLKRGLFIKRTVHLGGSLSERMFTKRKEDK